MPFTLELGKTPPDFKLPATDGKTYSPASFKDAKLLVIVFSCNHCPYVVGSEDRMIAFYNDYAKKGVAMIAINSNETVGHPTDSFEHMKTHVVEKKIPWVYVRDDRPGRRPRYGPSARRTITSSTAMRVGNESFATREEWTTTPARPAKKPRTSSATPSTRSSPAKQSPSP